MYIMYTVTVQKSGFPAAVRGHSLVRLGMITDCASVKGSIAFTSHPKKDGSRTDQILSGLS